MYESYITDGRLGNCALFLRPQGGNVLDMGGSPGEVGVRMVTTRQFRDNLFALMREVRETGCEVVVTNRGKPYARIAREIERAGEHRGVR